MKNKKRVVIFLIITTVLTLAFIWGNSLKTQVQSNESSDAVRNFLLRFFDPDGNFDMDNLSYLIRKLAHATEFMLLSMQITLILLLLDTKNFWIILFSTLFCAVIDETLQMITDRAPRVTDVLIDFSGAIVGMLLIYGTYYILKRHTKVRQQLN